MKKEEDNDKEYIKFLQEAVSVGTGAPRTDLGPNWNWGTVKDVLDYGDGKELKTTLDNDELDEVYEKVSGKKKEKKLHEAKGSKSPISVLEAEGDTEYKGVEKEKGEEIPNEEDENLEECDIKEGSLLEQESDVLTRLINEMDSLDEEALDEEALTEETEKEKEEKEDEEEEPLDEFALEEEDLDEEAEEED